MNDAIVRMMENRVIPCAMIDDVLAEWHTPRHAEFAPRTVWSLFNAVTECLKGTPNLLPARTTRLHSMCDSLVGFAKIVEGGNIGDAVDEPDYEVIVDDAADFDPSAN